MVRLSNIKFLTLSLIVIVLVGSRLAHAQSNIFYDSTFALPANGPCYYVPEYVYNSAGSTVIGTISLTSGLVDFFILNASQEEFVNHQNASTRGEGGCASLEPVDYELQARGLSVSNGYSFTYNVTDNGKHYFLFFNTQSANAIVSMVLSWGGLPAATQAINSLYTPSENESITSQTTVQMESGTAYMAAAVAVTFAVVLVAAWLYFGAMRKRQKEEETAQSSPAQETAAKPTPEQSPLTTKQVCIECGSELPADSKFCNKCGTKQVT